MGNSSDHWHYRTYISFKDAYFTCGICPALSHFTRLSIDTLIRTRRAWWTQALTIIPWLNLA